MGRNKDIRSKIASLLEVVAEHEAKIAAELKKPNPDQGLINAWRRHAGKARRNIEKLQRRLP